MGKKEKFQFAQAMRDSQGKLHVAVKEKIVALEESITSVKSRKECEGKLLDMMKKLRDTKDELVTRNTQLKEANEEIIALREQMMEIPDSMYIQD